jgi:hypothetical protein
MVCLTVGLTFGGVAGADEQQRFSFEFVGVAEVVGVQHAARKLGHRWSHGRGARRGVSEGGSKKAAGRPPCRQPHLWTATPKTTVSLFRGLVASRA